MLLEAQAGFRAKMGTTDHIFALHGLITHFINQNKQLFCTFVDFTKAFDYIVRENLWFKIYRLGIRGRLFNVIKSMYSHVYTRVKLQNDIGTIFESHLGLRQGECLSPILFSLYINDLEDTLYLKGAKGVDTGLLKIFLLMYADDIVIFANSADELQYNLDILGEYCKQWKLKVNINKTKVLIFRKGGRVPRNLEFLYDDAAIEIVNQFTYLGIVFTTGGSFMQATKTLAGQAQKAIYKLRKYLNKFVNITPDHKIELFDKLIKPILLYGSEVWGSIKRIHIERIHTQFIKYILSVKTSTQNDFILAETGRLDLQTLSTINMIKYWFKVICSPEHKYINLIYKLMLDDIEIRPLKHNWASQVKRVLSSLGFYHVWLAQGVGNYPSFLLVFKQRLTYNSVQNLNYAQEFKLIFVFY